MHPDDDAHAANEKHHLGVGHRLGSAPSASLGAAMDSELGYARFVAEGLSHADLAHCVMLYEQGIIPEAAARELLRVLLELHEADPSTWVCGLTEGDLYDHRDAWLRSHLGETSGWLHTGRARREAITLGWLLGLRHDVLALQDALCNFVDAMAGLCAAHDQSLMPDYTYLQHAHPTTLGHYLLGFVYPLVRDADRLADAYAAVSSSPAGSASTNGSRLPLDRERVRVLLGFESLVVHNRDAMWQPDVAIGLMSVVASIYTTIDRLAEELLLWSTQEFGFVELSDAHCRTSVIMPQKKNPYALSHLRGRARAVTGRLVTVIATNQTPSGQVDNRTAAYELVPLSLREAQESVDLMREVLTGARFDTERLADAAQSGGVWATELVEFLVETERIDTRTAHSLVGEMVAEAGDTRDPVTLAAIFADVFTRGLGRPWHGEAATFASILDLRRIVSSRSGIGSCGPVALRAMIDDIRAYLARQRTAVAHRRGGDFPHGLLSRVRQILNGNT